MHVAWRLVGLEVTASLAACSFASLRFRPDDPSLGYVDGPAIVGDSLITTDGTTVLLLRHGVR